MNINIVTVIGANGTMGANVAGIFASFGEAKVYLLCRDVEKAKKAIQRAAKSVRAESIIRRMIPADYSMLESCVAESDLVFESVAENMEIKQKITERIGNSLRKDAIACSGSSGLSITKLAECLPEQLRRNYMGVHMFNPPYSMPLCELTPTRYTERGMAEQLKEYLSKKLLRTVVEVKDSPAFLANRIGFQFINEALQCAERYKYSGGIDYIDAILGPFTGRAMAPLKTADFVGLDVHKAIVDNLYENTEDYAHESFRLPKAAELLIAQGRLGRKSGAGLYQRKVFDNGQIQQLVYDISTESYREVIEYHFPFAQKMVADLRTGDYVQAMQTLVENRSTEAELCLEFLLKYILYALYTAEQVGFEISAADDVMATGFNWCPPMALANVLSEVVNLEKLIEERLDKDLLEKIEAKRLLGEISKSAYDYRIYFKSKN